MKNKYKIQWITLVVALLMTMVSGAQVSAWGPERPTYTMAKPAERATFNSITDNAAVGDERDFVRIAEAGAGRAFTNELIIEPGKEYEVWIYFHNDASETVNDAAHNYAGLARNTRMISYYPEALGAGDRGKVEGYITSTTTDPVTVWDEAYITAKKALTIEYVEGSAHIYNKWAANGSELGKELFTADGTWLGLNNLNGLILGCNDFAGTVIYRIRTVAVEQPEEPKPDPEPEPTPDPEEPTPEPEQPAEPTPEPEKPQELPETGPAEVALAIVVVLALVAGIVYWRRTSHAVKKATRSAKGHGKRK